jgi:hypothetical protein
VASDTKVVVGAPDDDLAGSGAAAPGGVGRPLGVSLESVKMR